MVEGSDHVCGHCGHEIVGSHSVVRGEGIAHYRSLASGDDVLPDGAWYYPRPWPLARRIRGHVAFGSGVTVTS